MRAYRAKRGDGYQSWCEGVWVWTELGDNNNFDAAEWAIKWSREGDNFEDEKAVLDKIEEYRGKCTNCFGLGFVMKHINSKSAEACEFRKAVGAEYAKDDYEHLILNAPLSPEGVPIIDVHVVKDYLRSVFFIHRDYNCTIRWWQKMRSECDNFYYYREIPKTPFDGANDLNPNFCFAVKTDDNELIYKKTSFNAVRKAMVNGRDGFKKYFKVIFEPYFGGEKIEEPKTFNAFMGFRAKYISVEERKMRLEDATISAQYECIEKQWRAMICAGNEVSYEYMMNWFARMLKDKQKLRTILVVIGQQGTGKSLMFDKFLGSKIIGASYAKTWECLDKFFQKHNSARRFRCMHIFNEVTCAKSRQNSDKMKVLIDPGFTIEPKFREAEDALDLAANILNRRVTENNGRTRNEARACV